MYIFLRTYIKGSNIPYCKDVKLKFYLYTCHECPNCIHISWIWPKIWCIEPLSHIGDPFKIHLILNSSDSKATKAFCSIYKSKYLTATLYSTLNNVRQGRLGNYYHLIAESREIISHTVLMDNLPYKSASCLLLAWLRSLALTAARYGQ